MQLLVIDQTLAARKRLQAKRAVERLFEGAAPVPLKRHEPLELLLTQRARVEACLLQALLLQAVVKHVSFEGAFVSELSPTVGTFVRLFSGVFSRVCDKHPLVDETLAAL